jgi:hypothetical protein
MDIGHIMVMEDQLLKIIYNSNLTNLTRNPAKCQYVTKLNFREVFGKTIAIKLEAVRKLIR